MHRLKHTFRRHEEKRSDAFIKRRHELDYLNTLSHSPPHIALEDLSKKEAPVYQSWWRDLDPFNLKQCRKQTVYRFVSTCELPLETLQEMFSLFQNDIAQEQFFALLRLVAHAQHGRTIHRDIACLGAPLPRFQTQAIDVLVKRSPMAHHGTIPSWIQQHHPTSSRQQQHSRSRSMPYQPFTLDDDSPPSPGLDQFIHTKSSTHNRRHHRTNHSADADSIQHIMRKPLLLTQSFQPSFLIDDVKHSFNSNNKIPPPLPPQSTKPASLKYARRRQ